jgi:uncharacterized protein
VIPIFLDTSGLIAVVNSDDQWHIDAETAWRDLIDTHAPLITTSLVLIEIGDGLARIKHRQMAIDLFDRMHASSRVEVVQVTPSDEQEGWHLFRQRSDKEWGMTDCISMVIMRQRAISKVLSADGHFAQAGFHVLLQPSG